MGKQLVLFILVVMVAILSCSPLDSAVEQAEEAIPTLEAAAATVAQEQQAQSNTSEDNAVNEPSEENNEFCSILTFDDIKDALEANEVTMTPYEVGPDQATCGHTLDSNRILSMRVDATTSARSAKTIYEAVHVETFGTGSAVEVVQGPWTEGFWIGNVKGVFAVQDDEVAFSIQFPGGDASSRDGLVQLAALFFERFP